MTLSLLSCVVALYAAEIYLGFVEPRPAQADGRPFDGRTKIEVIADLRRDGVDAYVMAVHLRGHYCCTRPFARYIRETDRRNCRILCFSSVSRGSAGSASRGP